METVEILKKIKEICAKYGKCQSCPFTHLVMFCDTPPEYWEDDDIEEVANTIDNFKEEEK